MTSDDHNLVPSERGELARSGGETHPILSEIAGDLVARANKKDEPVPQGSRIGDPKIMLYETSMGQSFHNVYIFGPLFWISFSCVNEWDCELAAKVKEVGAGAVPEFCRLLTLRERDRGLSSNFEYRLPTEDESSKAKGWRDGADYKGAGITMEAWWDEVSDIRVGDPFRIILAHVESRPVGPNGELARGGEQKEEPATQVRIDFASATANPWVTPEG